MSLEAALMSDILAHPDDDTPRLVLADWLDDQGRECDCACAEFIRVQCRLARMPLDDPERLNLELTEARLAGRHPRRWSKSIRRIAKHWQLVRGFVGGVSMEMRSFCEQAEMLFARAPIQRLALWRHWWPPPSAECQPWLLPQLKQIRALRLEAGWGDGVIRLLQSEHLAGLRELEFGSQTRVDVLRAALTTPWRRELESLVLPPLKEASRDFLGATEQDRTPRLRRLRLDLCDLLYPEDSRGSRMTSSYLMGLYGLASGPGIYDRRTARVAELLSGVAPQLEVFDLQHNDLPGVGQAMARLAWPSLRHLILRAPGATGARDPVAGLGQILQLPLAQQLVRLDLSADCVHGEALAALGKQPLPQLQSLSLRLSTSHVHGLEALGRAAFAPTLHTLNLDGTRNLARGKVGIQFPEWDAFPTLRVLRLSNWGITTAGLRALLRVPWCQRLVVLDLGHNPLDDEAADLLAQHGPWPGLFRLDLRNTPLNKAACARLRQVFGEAVRYG